MRITRKDATRPRSFVKFGKLPGRPSELIRLALKDLKKSEKAGVVIDMTTWSNFRDFRRAPKGAAQCSVCMAGAVMMNTVFSPEAFGILGASRTQIGNVGVSPNDTDDEVEALMAIDSLRQGQLKTAFDTLGLRFPDNLMQTVRINDYAANKVKFKKEMADLATALAKQGY